MEDPSVQLDRGSSRLIVKNLPTSITVEKLRTLFASKGDVTDVQLKYTPDGHFRNFGFVGFNKEEQAHAALNYFNNTYIGATKIHVEKCAALGDPSKPRAWSKYTPRTDSRTKKRKSDQTEEDVEVVVKKKKEEEILEKCREDGDFLEFLQSHRKSSAWANDDILDELEKSVRETKRKASAAKDEKKEESTETEISSEANVGKTEKSTKNAEKRAKVLPEKEFFTVKLRNLPKKARKKDLKKFFESISLSSIRIPPKIRGIAYIGFKTEKDRTKGLMKDKCFLLGNKIAVYKYESKKKTLEVLEQKKSKWAQRQQDLEEHTETIGESGRIFIRNLSYSATEDDIRQLFEKFGPVTLVNLPLDRLTRQIKGIGFVTFMLPEHASKAYSSLDGIPFQGRMLHLLPAKNQEETNTTDANAGSSYKTSKELKKKKTAGQSSNWNTLFLGQNAVAEVVSAKYGVSREEFLLDNNDEKDAYQASAAVRMALAETEIVAETKTFLEQNGVSLDAFEGIRPDRSKTVLLVRNLMADTHVEELTDVFAKYGELGRVVLPPSGVTAIVEFLEPSEARRAFTNLAYSKFKKMPMYLEWAPIDAFKSTQCPSKKIVERISDTLNKSDTSKNMEIQNRDKGNSKGVPIIPIVPALTKTVPELNPHEEVDADMIPEPDTTIFVKNLNFTTNEEHLKSHFKACGPIYSVSIAKKRDPKQPGNMLSMGYGFVQYYFCKDSSNSIKELQGSVLQNHTLELKKSNRTLQTVDTEGVGTESRKENESTKILVRNIPFQATRQEVSDLFKTFGQLKGVRLPTKMDGSGEHRGFAFVEFHTKKDSTFAFTTLSKSTHLYGRRLVLEWAAADETVEELRAKTAKKYNLQSAGERQTNKSKTKTKQMMRYFDAQPTKTQEDDVDNNDD